MISSRSSFGTRKHRKLPFHKRVPVSEAAKQAVLDAVLELKPRRVRHTEWFASVIALMQAQKRGRR